MSKNCPSTYDPPTSKIGQVEQVLSTRHGLPGECEQETYNALKTIFDKYKNMKKRHMSRDRIAGIMHGAYLTVIRGN